jgi:hypothetical protein
LGAMRERAAFNVEGLSSSPVASEFARIIGYKGKLQSPFVFRRCRVR